MRRMASRTVVVSIAVAIAVGIAALIINARSEPVVTRARLERSLERTYSHRYVALAKILGHRGVSVRSMQAHAICDKGGPTVADEGPGGDWICQIAYIDANVPNPDGTAKVEMNVHANGCYTAVGSTKLVGPLNITDTRGRTVVNPANEFDACFDPKSPAAPDGTLVIVKPIPLPGAPQVSSPLTVPSGFVQLDARRQLRLPITCAANGPTCAGRINVTLMGNQVSRLRFQVPAGKTQTETVTLSPHQARDGGMLQIVTS